MSKPYNRILVEFDFLIDLDLGLFKYIKAEYNNPNFVDQNIIRMHNEKEIEHIYKDARKIYNEYLDLSEAFQ